MTAEPVFIPTPALQWDIFCQVIDNFGDIGVCWRLACDLAQRGQNVRLWIDDASALQWMAPHGCAGVQVLPWGGALPNQTEQAAPADVLIEAFGCEIAPETIAASARHIKARGLKYPQLKPPVWINLEYLSAESYVERCHRLPSPVQHGPAAGWTKWFFYPGFTAATGGLLRELDLAERQASFDVAAWRSAHLAAINTDAAVPGERWISLFCYEPPALAALLEQLSHADTPTQLLVTPGRASAAVQAVLEVKKGEIKHQIGLQPFKHGRYQLSISYLTPCTQSAFDELLWACDVNLVRGEDSLVRALWAGQPLVWHIHPQHDNAHHDKLHAFLDWLEAPPSLRQFHAVWNGIESAPLPVLDNATLLAWRDCVRSARTRLWAQKDLSTQLLGFCLGKR